MTSRLEPPSTAGRTRHLLLRDLVEARDALAHTRAAGASPAECTRARERLRDALEVYVDVLTVSHVPVPYSVRDELWLLSHVQC